MEVWLRDESDDSGHLPVSGSEDGAFNLNSIPPFTTMIVEGLAASGSALHRALGTRGQSVTPTTSSTVRVATSLPATPIYRSVTATKKVALTVKVVKAKMMSKKGSGNPEFESLSQMYIELTEATANIMHITEVVHKQWGTEYNIVFAEGIEIADSAATRGE